MPDRRGAERPGVRPPGPYTARRGGAGGALVDADVPHVAALAGQGLSAGLS